MDVLEVRLGAPFASFFQLQLVLHLPFGLKLVCPHGLFFSIATGTSFLFEQTSNPDLTSLGSVSLFLPKEWLTQGFVYPRQHEFFGEGQVFFKNYPRLRDLAPSHK